tara:strand:+ start:52980 stop:54347 length:1368 start_codon:yes stop_codon:yes gene_type:complete
MKHLIFLIALLISHQVLAQVPSLDMIYGPVTTPGDCRYNNCFSQSELVEKTNQNSFENRDGLLALFETRQNIKVRVGQLLPSFNLRIDNVFNVFDYIPNLIGFIFPSNWYRLKESKLHAKAQEFSFVSTNANQRNAASGLFLIAHQEEINSRIIFNHLNYAQELLELMELRYEYGEVAYEDIEEMNAFIAFMHSDYVIQQSLTQQLLLEIAYLVDDVQLSLPSAPVEIKLPDFKSMNQVSPEDLLKPILEASPELKSLEYLALATQYSKKSRVYDFLTPDNGTESALGFGTAANLRISQSEIERIEIKKDMFRADITKSLISISRDIKNASELNKDAYNIEKSLRYILASLIKDFETSSKIDINRFISLLSDNLRAQFLRNNSAHAYLVSKENLDRLLLTSANYQSISERIPTDTTKLDCYLRKENRKIQKAINSGTLKLPETIEFNDDDLTFCF